MPETPPGLRIVGRRSSLYTRVPLLIAETLRVPYGFDPLMDLAHLDPSAYAGNPSLKVPVLCIGDETLFGALNICRRIAREAAEDARAGIIWPDDLDDPLLANAQELISHCMSAQVQLVMGLQVCGLPAGNPFFIKTRAGLLGSLQWLDGHLPAIRNRLSVDDRLSFLEATLFCLLEHLEFRRTLDPHARFAALDAFRAQFGANEAASITTYRFDAGAADRRSPDAEHVGRR